MSRRSNLRSLSVYTRGAKIIHWVMAGLIFGMIIHGWSLDDLQGSELSDSLSYHAFGGMLVFALVVLRISWRIGYPPPPLPETMSQRQQTAAHLVHLSLYITMFLVPLTGLVAAIAHKLPVIVIGGFDLQSSFSFVGDENFNLKREIHAQTMHLLVALIIGHIGAALVHQFWLKDNLIRRMLTENESVQT